MDFSIPIYQEICKLYIQKPESKSLNWYTYIDVYARDFWIFTFVTVFAICLCIVFARLVCHLSYTILQSNRNESKSKLFRSCHLDPFHFASDSEGFNVINVFGVVGMALLQKEYPLQPLRISSMCLIFTTFIFAFLLYTTYCATLTSTLTLEVRINHYFTIFAPDFKDIIKFLTNFKFLLICCEKHFLISITYINYNASIHSSAV